MRQRNIKNLKEKLEMNSSFLIERPAANKGRWKEIFGNSNPIFLEIGCGKGRFIMQHAETYPERNFIAIEGQSNVALRALQKAEEKQFKNLRIFISYVDDLTDFFEAGELSGIFLNFSDPWPKARHAKRRLTYYKRLLNYKEVLSENGFIEFKTDNEGLFEFTLEEIETAGLKIIEMTRDLHGDSGLSCGAGKLSGGSDLSGGIELSHAGKLSRGGDFSRGDSKLPCGRKEAAAYENNDSEAGVFTRAGVEDGGRKFCELRADSGSFGDCAAPVPVITTEYEERFREKGKNINYVKFR